MGGVADSKTVRSSGVRHSVNVVKQIILVLGGLAPGIGHSLQTMTLIIDVVHSVPYAVGSTAEQAIILRETDPISVRRGNLSEISIGFTREMDFISVLIENSDQRSSLTFEKISSSVLETQVPCPTCPVDP